MADYSSVISCSNISSRQRKHFPLERRPRMLKDFLLDDSNSYSSNRFESFPRKPCQDSSIRNLIQVDRNSSHAKPSYGQRLQRSRSKAASTTISALQAMINAVKNIHFMTSVKTPSILPRSLSRKRSKPNSQKQSEIKITVRIKDIIRWKSFRDLAEENSPPSDFTSSPHHSTTATVTNTTTGSTCTPCRSNGSSWCDSDFTSEYLPSEESGENEVADVEGKKVLPCVGKDSMGTTTHEPGNTAMGPKGRKYASEEKEHKIPLSVLDIEYEEVHDEEPLSSFSRCLATMDRKKQKLMQTIQRFESLAKMEPFNLEKWMSSEETEEEDGDDDDDYVEEEEETNEVEEKAWQLLIRVKETSSLKSCRNITTDKLLLDLFREELAARWHQTIKQELEDDMVRQATSWINGEQSETAKWGVGDKREAYVRYMDREGKWSKFEEEQEELALEVESWVMNNLVDELLVDLL